MNELMLYGTVGQDFWGEEYFTATDIRAKLAAMEGPVVVRINSGGGIAAEGNAIYTMLRDYEGDVAVIIDGVAASAASLIAMAGDTITMRAGSVMMIHDPAQWFSEGRGTEEDHLRTARVLGLIGDQYAKIYAARAGITAERAREIMREETWYGPEEAHAAGFATDFEALEVDTETVAAAAFDYRIYANAPAGLRKAPSRLGQKMPSPHLAVAAVMAAQTAATAQGTRTMKKDYDEDMRAADEEERDMIDEEEEQDGAADPADPAEGGETGAPAPVEDVPQDEDDDSEDEDEEMSAAEASALILDLGMRLGRPMTEIRAQIAGGVPLAKASQHFIAQMQKENPMKANAGGGSSPARVTADGRDKLIEGATRALTMKARAGDGERNEFSGMSLVELARHAIVMSGEKPPIDRMQLVGRAFTMSGAGSHTTSDFAQILSNVMGKAALKGWEEAEETFERWTVKGSNADFKATKRVGAGIFGALPKIGEDGEYTYGTVGDRGEDVQIATYGRLLRLTRQVIINDDLSILGSVPVKMGRAAKRTVGNLAYAVLTSNPTMSDGTALFHADHANLASSGSAISVASFSAARAAMKTQKEAPGGSALNVRPAYFLTSAAQETTAEQLMISTVDPTASKGHAMNPVAGAAEVIADPRLDDDSATAWYLVANPSQFDTVEITYLDGNDTPFIEEQTNWNVDGVEMKVRIDAAATPLDHRSFYKNPGA